MIATAHGRAAMALLKKLRADGVVDLNRKDGADQLRALAPEVTARYQRATDLLSERFPARSGGTADIVLAAPSGLAHDTRTGVV